MKRIVIDTNLLVLLVIGLTDTSLIAKHKRTKSFEKADYDLLTGLLSNYDQIIVTPHILTEASNLVSQIGEPAMSELRKTFTSLLGAQEELYEPSLEVSRHPDFFRLGLTDTAILSLIGSNTPLVTTDLNLYLAAANANNNAINFNYLRQNRLLSA